MIKRLVRSFYKSSIKSDSDFEEFYSLRNTILRIELFLNLRIIVYYTATLLAISLIMNAVIPQELTSICRLIIVLIFGIFLGYFICVVLVKDSEELLSKYSENTKKAKNFLLKFFTLYRNDVISYDDWKKIKSVDTALYSKLTSDESLHLCYHYSLQLGLFLKDVDLAWCGVYCPFNNCYFAHAFILKNGYVYDSNHRTSHKFKDYAKAQHVKVYKTWSYNEFNIPFFRSTVRRDFRKWCKKNDVIGYQYF